MLRSGADEELADRRTRSARGRPDGPLVDRDLTPSEHDLPLRPDGALEQRHQLRLLARIVRQEAHRDAVAPALRQLEVDDGAQERVRHLDQDPGAVSGFGVGAGSATMLEVLERLDRQADDVVAGLVVQARDDRDAAGVMLVTGVVEAVGLLGLACPGHL